MHLAPSVPRSLTFQMDVPAELSGLAGGLTGDSLSLKVSRSDAISVPAVKRARDLIAGTLGTLPLRIHDAGNNLVPNELVKQPEIDVARSVTMTRTVEDMLFEGTAWWRVTEFGWHGYPTKVRKLDARTVQVRENARVYVNEDGMPQGQAMEWVPDAELIRIDSPNDALLVAGARAIRQALALDKTAARYANEPLPLGFFTPADGVADQDPVDIQELLDEWETARQTRAWGYVGAALKANALQWNPEELQLASARDHAVLEISRAAGIDPEDLGVSTTSRTYANAEQRRLDLLDFTLAAYVRAIEDRLSMADVVPDGHTAVFEYEGFLRSDTKSRMETYEIGKRVGVYNAARIARLERIPSAKPEQPAAKPAPAAPTEESSMSRADGITFTASEPVTIGFDMAEADAAFRVSADKRTVSGLAVPWNMIARSNGSKWKFAPNSLHWVDEGRIKLNRDHDRMVSVGRAVRLENKAAGLDASFRVARGADGDAVLNLAEDGVYDGFSIEIDFESEGDGWQVDPADESVRLVYSATLRATAITAMPAFDSARVASVVASREEPITMSAPVEQPPAVPAAPAAPAAAATPAPEAFAQPAVAPVAPDFTAFTAGLSEAIGTAVAEAFARLPEPQGRRVIPAGRAAQVREAPIYRMNGSGPSMVRDAWRARTEGDQEARERLSKFQRQTADAAEEAEYAQFAATTANTSAIIPPGYRPDLYVTQLMKGRPLVNSVSRGTINDATPFTVPSFTSSSGLSANHVEGVNPTAGTITVSPVTVTPGGISGLFQVTREIVDSSNPAIDAIAMQAMTESYSQQTEAKVYTELNGANGQGGVITAGFVPSGAQVITTTGGSAAAGTFGGKELIGGMRGQVAIYPFRRFAAPNRAHASQEGTSALATAVDSDGRPLLPSVGPTNAYGLGNAVEGSWLLDGLAVQPTWSMTGNAAGDADFMAYNSNDIWAWESGLLSFRFEERNGPALIDLALFGYFATRVLRPVGITAIRHTVGA